jgi:hypothetical protein
VTKPLEPTEEQVRAIELALRRGAVDPWSNGPIADDTWGYMARAAWDVIRDQVLHAAARECANMSALPGLEEPQFKALRAAAVAIRAMKGTP